MTRSPRLSREYSVKKLVKFLVFVLCFVLVLMLSRVVVRNLFPVRYEKTVTACAKEHALEKELIYAMIKAESNFDASIESRKGAVGLMQIMDTTGAWVAEQQNIPFRKEDLYDVDKNIEFGAFYLAFLLDRYEGNKTCAIAAYNAGHANVDKWLLDKTYSKDGKSLDAIPFPETEKYVKQVLKFQKIYQYLYGEKNR